MYKTGTKHEVILQMSANAIRDQIALIEAYTPQFGEPDEFAAQVIQDCKDRISDYRKLVTVLCKD
jgi:hypothetical protein